MTKFGESYIRARYAEHIPKQLVLSVKGGSKMGFVVFPEQIKT